MNRKLTEKQEAKEKNLGGRPTLYTDEIADKLCESIAMGSSMVKACSAEGMPAPRTVYKWLREKEGFLQNYEHAKEDQADLFAEEVVEISDNAQGDYIEVEGCPQLVSENIQRSRLRVDARKWTASKFKSKRYGDKIQQEITAPEGVVFNMSFGGKNEAD